MKYKIKTEFSSWGNQVVEAKSPKEAYQKACDKVFKVNQDNIMNNKNRRMKLTDVDRFFYERPKRDVLIIDENEDVFCSDGRKYEDYLEENYNLYESEYIDEKNIGNMHYIWGVVSGDYAGETEDANFNTMNDIDVVYNSDTKVFNLSFEEIYHFDNRNDLMKYLDGMLYEFKKYMISNGYDSEELKKTNECSIFEKVYPTGVLEGLMPLEAKTLLDLYYKFKLFISCYKKITQV